MKILLTEKMQLEEIEFLKKNKQLAMSTLSKTKNHLFYKTGGFVN